MVETKKCCYSCVRLQLKPMTLIRSHRSDTFSVMLLKILGRLSATFGRASENEGLLAVPD